MHPHANHSHEPMSASLRTIGESSEASYSVNNNNNNAGTLNDGMINNNGPDEKPSYKDYLKAQRNLHHRHNNINSPPTSSSSTFHSHNNHHHHHHHIPSPPTSRRQQLTDKAYQQNLQSMAMLGQRNNSLLSNDNNATVVLWDTIMESPHAEHQHHHHTDHSGESFGNNMEQEEEKKKAEDHHSHHPPTTAGKVPYYAPPMQRVFYGKPQVLPHVNWGDLFFDLFFVAMAYNLGTMMISALNDEDWLRGTVYFLAIFGSLFQTWYNDLAFSSRYTVLDHVHRLIWGLKFFSVGGAILFVNPINLMSDPHSFESIGFISALLVEALISTGLQMEVYFKAMGDRIPIEKHSKRTLRNYHLPTVILYTTALVLAVMAYLEVEEEEENTYYDYTDGASLDHGNSSTTTTEIHHEGVRRALAGSTSATTTDVSCSSGSRLLLARMLGATSVECSGHRFLAAASISGGGGDDNDCSCHTGALLEIRDLPLGIICFAYFFNIFFSLFRSMCLASGAGKDIRDRFVPNNLDYVIHRYGEWIMLMIGESVLSLLIVETIEDSDYFVIACLGVLNVMCVHTLIFESQPSTSAGHAIFRSFKGQLSFGLLVQLLSMGLIAFGICFKIMLSTALAEAESSSYRRRLAGKVSVSNEMTATLFSISLTVILLSLELMLVTHKGKKQTFQRLWKNRDGGSKGIIKKIHKPLLGLTITKIGLIVFVATLSQWETRLTEISWIGLTVVFAMLVSRVIAWGLVHKEDKIRHLFANGLNAVLPKKQQPQEEQSHLNDIEEGREEESKEIEVNRDAWDKSNDCIVVCSKSGGIKYANKTALAEFGYKSELDLIGKDISVLGKQDGTKEEEGGDRRKGFKDMGRLESHRESWNESMDNVVVIDRKGIIQFANPMTLQEFGYGSEEELVGKDIAVLVGGGEAMNHGTYMKAMHTPGKIPSKVVGLHRASSNKSGEKRLLYAKRKDGTEFPCLIGLKPIGSDYIAGFIKNQSELSSVHNNKEELIRAA